MTFITLNETTGLGTTPRVINKVVGKDAVLAKLSETNNNIETGEGKINLEQVQITI